MAEQSPKKPKSYLKNAKENSAKEAITKRQKQEHEKIGTIAYRGRAGMHDYRAWVSRWTENIERANASGDLKAVYKGVKAISGAATTFSDAQPTFKTNGNRIKDPEELAAVWAKISGK